MAVPTNRRICIQASTLHQRGDGFPDMH